MRAFHGQMSDNQPIRRTLAEKQKQLRDLRETLATMKSHTSPALRESVQKRIRQLESEVSAAPALKAGEQRNTPRSTTGTDRPRSPRRRPERSI
ncbi:hypothetical protein KOEU_21880 [Komagataeibacter europaeus]|uniref:Uncharacterized protein n=2 Tax=Komagataeibacter europaeus TaxID=33995 RepID=A0A0D6PZP2_KOMEU|nr:hypothetical protein [Komagataeibacter europaeus]ARW17643.1 hypothetical protein S101446_02547 [Komagataeibacter europaeus]KON64289.1 hypothetical protein KOEU_21880 [Komagataeibacter europaeus]GAN96767.1 hypothetical protein Geu3261_0097_010 [Komagataeibacter europaeus NBRC 3261]GBQ44055.1 hypothetical protein AA18890_2119 [Komagataeibacter europaeus LMG 18890]